MRLSEAFAFDAVSARVRDGRRPKLWHETVEPSLQQTEATQSRWGQTEQETSREKGTLDSRE